MAELIANLGVVALGVALLAIVQQRFRKDEASWLQLSLLAHLGATFVQLGLVWYVYGTGDVLSYHLFGTYLANAFWDDPAYMLPQIATIILGGEPAISIPLFGGANTRAMVALTSLACVPLANSMTAVSMFFAMVSFFGKVMMYGAVRDLFPWVERKYLFLAVLFVPTTVLWSAGIIKEGIAMAGLSMVVWALVRPSRLPIRVGLFVVGAFLITTFKAYILVAAGLAIGAYYYLVRAAQRGVLEIRPLPLIASALVAFVAIYAVGYFVPRFSLEGLVEETARMQQAAVRSKGGSTYSLGGSYASSLSAQLVLAPLGLLTGLYRPSILDARNPQMLVNGLETLAFLVFSARPFINRTLRAQVRPRLLAQPFLGFAIVFTLVFGTGTGLTAANLGTLSRYRMPLVPFLCLTLAALNAPVRRRYTVSESE